MSEMIDKMKMKKQLDIIYESGQSAQMIVHYEYEFQIRYLKDVLLTFKNIRDVRY